MIIHVDIEMLMDHEEDVPDLLHDLILHTHDFLVRYFQAVEIKINAIRMG